MGCRLVEGEVGGRESESRSAFWATEWNLDGDIFNGDARLMVIHSFEFSSVFLVFSTGAVMVRNGSFLRFYRVYCKYAGYPQSCG